MPAGSPTERELSHSDEPVSELPGLDARADGGKKTRKKDTSANSRDRRRSKDASQSVASTSAGGTGASFRMSGLEIGEKSAGSTSDGREAPPPAVVATRKRKGTVKRQRVLRKKSRLRVMAARLERVGDDVEVAETTEDEPMDVSQASSGKTNHVSSSDSDSSSGVPLSMLVSQSKTRASGQLEPTVDTEISPVGVDLDPVSPESVFSPEPGQVPSRNPPPSGLASSRSCPGGETRQTTPSDASRPRASQPSCSSGSSGTTRSGLTFAGPSGSGVPLGSEDEELSDTEPVTRDRCSSISSVASDASHHFVSESDDLQESEQELPQDDPPAPIVEQADLVADVDAPDIQVPDVEVPVVRVAAEDDAAEEEPQELRPIGNIHVAAVTPRTHCRAWSPVIRDPDAPELVPFHLGAYGAIRCPHCDAYKFNVEEARRGDTMSGDCCTGGTVRMEATVVPVEYRNTFFNPGWPDYAHLQRNLRGYNTGMAFASFRADIPQFNQGPSFITIQGQAYEARFGGPVPQGNQAPRYNQLYYLETTGGDLRAEAALAAHQNLRANIFAGLELLMGRINPFAAGYRTLRQRVHAEQQRAAANAEPEPAEVYLSFRVPATSTSNRPTSHGEMAVVSIGEPARDATVTVSSLLPGNRLTEMHNLNPLSEPMLFPLMFPHGEAGYRVGLPQHQADGAPHPIKTVTIKQFYRHRIAQRDYFSLLHRCARVFQLYVVLAHLKSQAEDLFFLQRRARDVRSDNVDTLARFVQQGQQGRVGGALRLLPSSLVGSPRWYKDKLEEAKAITAHAGLPTYLITFTCNRGWPEIRDNLVAGTKVEDRPDLVAHVFQLKLTQLEKEIRELQIFGVVIAYLRVIEFQKRGLPHAHILLTVRPEDVPRTGAQLDRVIEATIPNPMDDGVMHHLVTTLNLHEKCTGRREAPCYKRGAQVCSKGFPKPFRPHTSLRGEDNKPQYRRPADGPVCDINNVRYTNQDVVPFNRYLTERFGTHINVELCSDYHVLFYLFDYIFKGQDHTKYGLGRRPDEMTDFQNSRYTGSCEAAYRTKGYRLCVSHPPVVRLKVHLPGEQRLLFEEGLEQEALDNELHRRTTLTAAFELFTQQQQEGERLYEDLVRHHVFSQQRRWTPRRAGHPVPLFCLVGRPGTNLVALAKLLKAQVGPVSFEALRTVNDVVFETFREAAVDNGLFALEHRFGLAAIESVFADERRQPQHFVYVFCVLVASHALADPTGCLERHRDDIAAIFPAGVDEEPILYKVLRSLGTDVVDLGLTDAPNRELMEQEYWDAKTHHTPLQVQQALAEYRRRLQHQLNLQQAAFVRETGRAVHLYAVRHIHETDKVFFLEGPAGSGKTFVYETLIHMATSRNLNVLVCSTSGISASLLPGGITVHKAFGLPLHLHHGTSSLLAVQSPEAQWIRSCAMIICDEMGTATRHMLDAINRFLQDLHQQRHALFGGVPIVLGGDFRQMLPVYQRAHAAQCIENGVQKWSSWERVQVRRLLVNVRARGGTAQFRDFLMQVGNGTVPLANPQAMEIRLPDHLVCRGNLVHEIFGSPIQVEQCQHRAILCPTNQLVSQVNDYMCDIIGRENGTYRTYPAVNVWDSLQGHADIPLHVLQFLNPANVGPDQLRTCVGAVVMLVKNIDPEQGMTNGARFQVTRLTEDLIYANFITGPQAGREMAFVRVNEHVKDSSLPIEVMRQQFPLRASFALTINKAQGQTLHRCGVWLPKPVFSHGQVYVAFSRVARQQDLKVKIGSLDGDDHTNLMRLVVEKDALLD